MKIGLNATYLGKEFKTGIEKYSDSAIRSLIESKKHEFHLFSQLPLTINTSNNVISHISPFVKGWHSIRLPLSLLLNPVEIFVEMGYSVPPFSKMPTVVVVHDLAYKYFPESYSPQQIAGFDRTFNNISLRASGIVFVSKNTKADFDKFFPGSKARNRVIYQSLPLNESVIKHCKKDVIISQEYILSVGRLESRKNTVKLIEAYKHLRTERKDFNHKLVLVGSKGYGYNKIAESITKCGVFSEDVVEWGYADNEDLRLLYQNATVFVYPSLYEGFGIPLLESFAARTPVVCSNCSSLPEVAGNAVLFCDPHSLRDIAEKIISLITDKNLSDDLTNNGVKQLNKFSWHRHTSELLDFIKEVYENRSNS